MRVNRVQRKQHLGIEVNRVRRYPAIGACGTRDTAATVRVSDGLRYAYAVGEFTCILSHGGPLEQMRAFVVYYGHERKTLRKVVVWSESLKPPPCLGVDQHLHLKPI
jgi:hypothetical protein